MDDQQASDCAGLGWFLDGCGSLDHDVEQLLREAWSTSSLRQIIAMAFCKAALEHAVGQRLLIGSGQHGTALALIRLHFETTIRAAWACFGAKDDWLKAFAEPVPPGSFKEPTLGPPLPSMLDAIEPSAPDIAQEGRRLNATIKAMHSFVHGGAHLVVHALRGYPPSNLIDVLKNRNLLLVMLSNVIVATAGDAKFNGAVGRIMRAHANVMPPARS